MNQRYYSWGVKEITKFLDDIFSIFEKINMLKKWVQLLI